MIKFPLIVNFAAAYLISLGVHAQSLGVDHDSGHDHELAAQAVHLHGQAELTLVLEANSLQIRLESPAVNIVGFEHRAQSSKQQKMVDSARSILESPMALFSFSGSECDLLTATANLQALIGDDHPHHADEDTDHSPHDDHHSEVTASYRYTCERGEKLKTVRVALIDHFPGIKQIGVQWITDTRQGSVELNADTDIIPIR